eukprot:g2649.t1
MNEECLEAQSDELEALLAIYEDSLTKLSKEKFRLTLKHHFALTVEMPPGYPFVQGSLPSVIINFVDASGNNDKSLSPLMVSKILSSLRHAANEFLTEHATSDQLGEPILFDLIERLREVIADEDHNETDTNIIIGDDDDVIKCKITEERDTIVDHHVRNGDSTAVSSQATQLSSRPSDDQETSFFFHGEPFIDRKSVFQAHIATNVSSVQQVDFLLSHLLRDRKIAKATHNIYAYRFIDSSTQRLVSSNDDDGETAAGRRLQELLHLMKVEQVFVVVSRWYGGIKLGPARFKHINNAARQLLETLAGEGKVRKEGGKDTQGTSMSSNQKRRTKRKQQRKR